MGWGKVAIRIAAEGDGCNRNTLPLRSERSSIKLENTSLSTGVPLGFPYAAFPLPPLQHDKLYVFLLFCCNLKTYTFPCITKISPLCEIPTQFNLQNMRRWYRIEKEMLHISEIKSSESTQYNLSESTHYTFRKYKV